MTCSCMGRDLGCHTEVCTLRERVRELEAELNEARACAYATTLRDENEPHWCCWRHWYRDIGATIRAGLGTGGIPRNEELLTILTVLRGGNELQRLALERAEREGKQVVELLREANETIASERSRREKAEARVKRLLVALEPFVHMATTGEEFRMSDLKRALAIHDEDPQP